MDAEGGVDPTPLFLLFAKYIYTLSPNIHHQHTPLHDSTECVILCTVEREKGKRGANTYPTDRKGVKEMSEEIKSNKAVLRTGVIITGVYMGLALVGACYLISIM